MTDDENKESSRSVSPLIRGFLDEKVAAGLAVLIALVALGLLVAAATVAGKFEEFRELALIGLSVFASVVGYYFGSKPNLERARAADARIGDLQSTASTATEGVVAAQASIASMRGNARLAAARIDLATKMLKPAASLQRSAAEQPAPAELAMETLDDAARLLNGI